MTIEREAMVREALALKASGMGSIDCIRTLRERHALNLEEAKEIYVVADGYASLDDYQARVILPVLRAVLSEDEYGEAMSPEYLRKLALQLPKLIERANERHRSAFEAHVTVAREFARIVSLEESAWSAEATALLPTAEALEDIGSAWIELLVALGVMARGR